MWLFSQLGGGSRRQIIMGTFPQNSASEGVLEDFHLHGNLHGNLFVMSHHGQISCIYYPWSQWSLGGMKGIMRKSSALIPQILLQVTIVIITTQPAMVFVPDFHKVTIKQTKQQSKEQSSETEKEQRCCGQSVTISLFLNTQTQKSCFKDLKRI